MGRRGSYPAGGADDVECDAALMVRARSNPDAFTELYRRHAGSVYAWCSRRSIQFAADLTAETFAQAWISRRRFRNNRDDSALPWLLGIARNLLRESERRRVVESKARQKLGLPVDLGGEEQYTRVEKTLSPEIDVQDALSQLPTHERMAVELRVVEEMPYEEVARRLDIQPAAARLRVSRGLRRMGAALRAKEEI